MSSMELSIKVLLNAYLGSLERTVILRLAIMTALVMGNAKMEFVSARKDGQALAVIIKLALTRVQAMEYVKTEYALALMDTSHLTVAKDS